MLASPSGLARRIRTWFFLACDPGGDLALAADEAIAAEWVRPSAMLTRHGRGEVTLYPPTWVTLHELTEHASAAGSITRARLDGPRSFETVARQGEHGPMMLWQAMPSTAPAGQARRMPHPVIASNWPTLPWVYTRTV